jgi:hypothetical protein
VLAQRGLTWLATEREKVQYFTHATPLRLDELPHVRFGRDSNTTIRHCAEKLPIGVDPEGRQHVFAYLVTHPHPGNFRLFLHRHAELLRALPSWTVRALFPKVLLGERRAFELAFYEECGSPLMSVDIEEFSWLRRQPRVSLGADPKRAEAARRRFSSARFAVHNSPRPCRGLIVGLERFLEYFAPIAPERTFRASHPHARKPQALWSVRAQTSV